MGSMYNIFSEVGGLKVLCEAFKGHLHVSLTQVDIYYASLGYELTFQ